MATATPDDIDYSITYITFLGDRVERKDGDLTISYLHGLVFSGHIEKQINIASLRWISKQQYTGFPKPAQHCFVVSYLDADSEVVSNVFFQLKTEREDIDRKCLEHLKDLLTVKYQFCTEDLEKINDVVAVLSNQPILMERVNMTVMRGEEGELDEAVEASADHKLEFLMIIDLECICLYAGELTKPVHRLMFWEEASVNSIERVKLMKKTAMGESKENTVYFQTKTESFAFNADQETVKQIQNIIPKKKNLMADPKLMLEIVVSAKHLNWRPPLPPKRSDNWTQDIPQSYSAQGAVGGYGDLRSEVNYIAERFSAKLRTAEETFRGNEDMQNMWIAIEFDIKEIIESGTVPATDYRSGGMSAESGEHLEKALQDVEDQLRENNLPVAISRLQACRELFGNSSITSIRQIFNKNDLELLQSLYFKSLCE